MRLFSFDDPDHREASVLLPWFVNGTLEEAERARVERHVGECVACRREVDAQRRLAEALSSAAPPSGVEAGLRSLHARLPLQAENAAPPARGWFSALAARWPYAVIAVQLLALALLLPANLPQQAPYRTLSSSPTAQAPANAVVVVFDAGATHASVSSLLRELRLRMVDGPNRHGAYVLEPEGGQQQALDALRASALVRFAQPAPGSSAGGN